MEIKLGELVDSISQDYKRFKKIDNIVNYKPISKSDGTFIKIGVHPGFKRSFFNERSDLKDLSYLGRSISEEEINQLINVIKKDCEIIKIQKEDIKKLKDIVNSINPKEESIICSLESFKNKGINDFIHFNLKVDSKRDYYKLFHDINFFFIKNDFLKDKFIIISKDAIMWEYIKNKDNKIEESIQKIIHEKKDGASIEIFTLNKVHLYNKKLIKIFRLID